MTNQEQLDILKKGAKSWNTWREENPKIEIDLSEAFRSGSWRDNEFDLSEFNLSNANLRRADLSARNNNWDDHYEFISLIFGLDKANLSGADLREADLRRANLRNANLIGADLRNADLSGTDITGSIFTKATIGGTNFGASDLGKIIGLEDVVHSGPSNISTRAVSLSKGKIPEVFLRGCGLSDVDIEYTKLSDPDLSNQEINKILYKIYDLRASQAIQISPLFISYSHVDSAFVDKLEGFLNKKGVRFWRDIHDMKSGRMEKQVDRAMRLNPTVLLILSEHSLQSDWVEHEVRRARALEKEVQKDILCPVALDDSWKNSPWAKRIMEQILEYNILDFSEWDDDIKFRNVFNKLIDGLGLFYK